MLMKKRAEVLIDRRRQDLLDSISSTSGKDIAWDDEKHSRIVEKEGRRRRRREARSKGQGSNSPHYEGQSSDDEFLQSLEKNFQLELGELHLRAHICSRGYVVSFFLNSHAQQWLVSSLP